MALQPQQFCVRWNSYHTNLQTVFPRLLLTEQFADVTLACESRQLRCHKLVLSACSAYLERLLVQNPCKHPIVFMKDMRFSEMQALVDFMYKGEVNVTQDELPSLLKSAEALQIRGLCSGDTNGLSELVKPNDTKDFAVATEALLAQAHRDTPVNGSAQSPPSSGQTKPAANTSQPAAKKRKSSENTTGAEVKEETVEEDGLYYGELDNENMEYNEDDDSGKPGSSLGQSSDFAIANVSCHYDSESEDDGGKTTVARAAVVSDHSYDRVDEPPAFVIQQVKIPSSPHTVLTTSAQIRSSGVQPYVEVSPKFMTLGPGCTPSVNVIRMGDSRRLYDQQTPPSPQEACMNKRIRRSEEVLKEAAASVTRGLTFQTVSEQFNIPISTIRFFMARKGILPRRRRGRHGQTVRTSNSPEPPFHMQHYKLPDMVAFKDIDDQSSS